MGSGKFKKHECGRAGEGENLAYTSYINVVLGFYTSKKPSGS